MKHSPKGYYPKRPRSSCTTKRVSKSNTYCKKERIYLFIRRKSYRFRRSAQDVPTVETNPTLSTEYILFVSKITSTDRHRSLSCWCLITTSGSRRTRGLEVKTWRIVDHNSLSGRNGGSHWPPPVSRPIRRHHTREVERVSPKPYRVRPVSSLWKTIRVLVSTNTLLETGKTVVVVSFVDICRPLISLIFIEGLGIFYFLLSFFTREKKCPFCLFRYRPNSVKERRFVERGHPVGRGPSLPGPGLRNCSIGLRIPTTVTPRTPSKVHRFEF